MRKSFSLFLFKSFGFSAWRFFLVLMLVGVLFPSFSLASSSQKTKTDSLWRVSKLTQSDTLRISALTKMGTKLASVHMMDSAQKVYKLGLSYIDNLLESRMDDNLEQALLFQKVNILYRLGNVTLRIGDPNQAHAYLKESHNLSKEIGYKSGEAWTLQFLGKTYDYQGNLNEALECFENSLELFREISDSVGIAEALNSLGHIYDYHGNLAKGLHYYRESLKVHQQIGDNKGIADRYNNIGVIYYLEGNNELALDYYYKSIALQQELTKANYEYAITLNNIGLIYENQGKEHQAIDYYLKSLSMFEGMGYGTGQVMPLNNLGDIYHKQDDTDKALEYFLKSYGIASEAKDAHFTAYSLDKICLIYTALQHFEQAYYYCNKCYEEYEKIGDKHGKAQSLIRVGNLYQVTEAYENALKHFTRALNIYKSIGDKQGLSHANYKVGKVHYLQNRFNNSFDFLSDAYNMAKELNYPRDIILSAILLDSIHRRQGNYKKAITYVDEYVSLRDSLNSDITRQRMQEQYYKYEYEKRAAKDSVSHAQAMEIKSLELARKSEQARRQQWVIYSVALGLLILLFFSLTLLRFLNDKRIAYKQLAQSNAEINQQKEEITSQRDEIESQRDLLQIQNEELEKFRDHTTHSLRYAQSIQAAIMPSQRILQQLSNEYFLLMKPCELVSGDFFWVTAFDEFQVFCVADCTGHGVPGAFMSILGVSALNDVVTKHRINDPSGILGHLRQGFVEALSQNDPENMHKDGMDIALCVFNMKTRTLQFAGAGLSLWLVPQNIDYEPSFEYANLFSHNQHKLFEVKGDNMPVGKSYKISPFTNYTIPFNNNTFAIYLATDGFVDQFSNGEKFGKGRLIELILSNNRKPFKEQGQILNRTFDEWKGGDYQIDDATVLGIKI